MRLSRLAGDRRGILAAAVTAVLLLTCGALVFVAGRGPAAPPQPAPPQPAPAVAAPASPSTTSEAPPSPASPAPSGSSVPPADATSPQADFGPLLGPSDPVALRIPAIGVDTRGIVDLGLDRTGRLEAPKDFAKTGWYAGGPTPGEFGPAVIGGHVDSQSGPAVFYRLGALRKGDVAEVTRADKSVARFVIDRVARYSKADFPTATVYGNTTDRAELRLITCGGAFDQSTGHYVDNIVAFGHLVVR